MVAHPHGGTHVPALQWQHGVDVRGTDTVQLDRIRVRDVFGDCVYVGLGGGHWASNVHISDGACSRNGRQGYAIVGGLDVVVEHNALDSIALNAFDIEPNGMGDGAANVMFAGNTVTAPVGQSLLAVIGEGPVYSVALSHNTLIGEGLHAAFVAPIGQRRSRILVIGNKSDTPSDAFADAALNFERITGITVMDNYVPLGGNSAALISMDASTGLYTAANSHPGGTEIASAPPP
jgi:hypothetical protein